MFENRRKFLQAAAFAAGAYALNARNASSRAMLDSRSRVSLTSGNDRRDLLYRALEPFREELKAAAAGKQIVIKPNVVEHDFPLAVTNIEALRGVLDFFSPLTDQKIIIGESTAAKNRLTAECFEKHGYTALPKEYNVELLDTALGPYNKVGWIKKADDSLLYAYITSLAVDPKRFLVSLAILKTHSTAVCTLALKNFAMGICLNFPPGHPLYVPDVNSRTYMHWGDTGPKGVSTNIALMAKHVLPGFAIIDGFVGMENEGPSRGTPVEHRVAVAGPDVVSVDRVGLELMGIDYNVVKHVQWASDLGIGEGNLSAIEIIGESLVSQRRKYKMHPAYEQQIAYQLISPHPDWTGVDEQRPIPLALVNYPNPFNASTMIQFALPVYSHAELGIFSIQGQRIRKIISSHLPAGKHSYVWNGRDDDGRRVSSGAYILRLDALSNTTTRKISFIQ